MPLKPPVPAQGEDFTEELSRYLCSFALKVISARLKAGLPSPTMEELSEALYRQAWAVCGDYIDDSFDGKRQKSRALDDVVRDRTAPRAAEWALIKWKPDFRERAAKGGRKGARWRTRFFEFMLIDHDDETAAETSARLGCSKATVYRLRESRSNWLAEHSPKSEVDHSNFWQLIGMDSPKNS